MLVDDSVQDKRYSRFIELVKLQYSGAEHGPVRGIGIVNLVHGAGVRKDFYPMDYRFLLIHSWNLSRFPPPNGGIQHSPVEGCGRGVFTV
jgi:hypothetical protein